MIKLDEKTLVLDEKDVQEAVKTYIQAKHWETVKKVQPVIANDHTGYKVTFE